MYHSSSSVFMTTKILVVRKASQKYWSRKPPNNKILSSSDGLVQNCASHNDFHAKQQHFTLSSTWPLSLFHNFSLMRHWTPQPFKNYGFICGTILPMCACTQSTKQWTLMESVDCICRDSADTQYIIPYSGKIWWALNLVILAKTTYF